MSSKDNDNNSDNKKNSEEGGEESAKAFVDRQGDVTPSLDPNTGREMLIRFRMETGNVSREVAEKELDSSLESFMETCFSQSQQQQQSQEEEQQQQSQKEEEEEEEAQQVKKCFRFNVNRDQLSFTFDEVRIQTVPRFKQSFISGSMWRLGTLTSFYKNGKIVRQLELNGTVQSKLEGSELLRADEEDLDSVPLDYEIHTLDCENKSTYCDQPGCARQATVVFEVKAEYCTCCSKKADRYDDMPRIAKFCDTHKDRGNSSFNDCNDNYTPSTRITLDDIRKVSTWQSTGMKDPQTLVGLSDKVSTPGTIIVIGGSVEPTSTLEN